MTRAFPPSGLAEHPEPLVQSHPFRQWKTWRMPGDLTLTGYSRANDKTFFHIPELRCVLDAGLCEGRRAENVFLTHTHHDHVKDLDFLADRDGGTDIWLPAEAVPYVEDYLRSSAELNHGAAYDPAVAGGHRLHGVGDGDTFTFGRRGHRVRVVRCEHKVPCVGYAFSAPTTSVLPEYADLRAELLGTGRGAEFGRIMARKRREGVAVDEVTHRPLFAFLGDTHTDVFADNPWLFDYPVLITECTFLDDAEKERADRVGHTVWSRLAPIVAAHPATLFVLTHFSLRYTDRDVLEFFRAVRRQNASGGPANILPWVHPGSRLPEQHQSSRG